MTEEQAKYKIDGRPSTIFRTVKNKDNPYVMIDRRVIDNPNLSFKAKGMLAYLLSRPDGWETNLIDLNNRTSEGLWSIKSGVKELKNAGHLRHVEIRDKSGHFEKTIWEVHEVPQVGNQLTDEPHIGVSPQVGFPQVGNPQVGNHTQVVLSTLSSNELNNSEPENEKIKKPPQLLFWDTLVGDIKNDPNHPPASRQKIALGHPVTWLDGTEKVLVVEHPDPEWANQRWSRILSNLMQGLCPGARVEFVEPGGSI